MSPSDSVFRVGVWELTFDPEQARLVCTHAGTGATVGGCLAFTSPAAEYTVGCARDGVPTRLALIDGSANVQGYIVPTANGDRLELLVMHRTAQSYSGQLTLSGTLSLQGAPFACRTTAPATGRVIQMATGPADSALNDGVFDIDTDTALRLGGSEVCIESGAENEFSFRATARIEDAACNRIAIELLPDYFRARYVPYYRPIDRSRCPRVPTGWMSWNVYFDQAGSRENLDEARIGAEKLKPFGLEFWSIESWQNNSDKLPVSKFHNLDLSCLPEQFPEGMKWLADEIRALGFRPGIWTAPFGTGNAEFYEAHKSWFLHRPDGTPFTNWCGKYLLDPSQPEARDHMRRIHRIMSEEWGYEFFKIDGMSGRAHSYSAHFFERDEVQEAFSEPDTEAFEQCARALREGIGEDRVFLACQGHYSGPDAAVADASRIGGDIVSPNKPSTWRNILSQARATVNQLFVNNIVFHNDPDTLLVGDYHSLEEARVTTAVVGLPGQLMFAGDKLGELTDERVRLLQQVLPVCDIRPLDLYPVFQLQPVWDLKVKRPFGRWDVVALFNWADTDEEIGFSFSEAGLPGADEYLIYEFWEEELHGLHAGGFSLTVPARGCRLLTVRSALPQPQFMSTDRHLTQGAVSIHDLAWHEDAKELTVVTDLVPGHATKLRFHVPAPFRFVSAEVTGSVDVQTDVEGDTLCVTLSSDAGAQPELKLGVSVDDAQA